MADLLTALGHERFAMVGHGLGMWTGYALAADHPGRLVRLALAEAAVPGLPPRRRSSRARAGFAPYRALDGTIAQNQRRAAHRLTLPVLAIIGAQNPGAGSRRPWRSPRTTSPAWSSPTAATSRPGRLRGNCCQRCGPSSPPIGTKAVLPPRASAPERASVRGEAPVDGQLQNAVSVADMTALALFSASLKVPGSAVTARPTERPSSVAPPRVS